VLLELQWNYKVRWDWGMIVVLMAIAYVTPFEVRNQTLLREETTPFEARNHTLKGKKSHTQR
jgi:hypothetical protein